MLATFQLLTWTNLHSNMIAMAIKIMSTWWYPRNGISPNPTISSNPAVDVSDTKHTHPPDLKSLGHYEIRLWDTLIALLSLPLPSSLVGVTLEPQAVECCNAVNFFSGVWGCFLEGIEECWWQVMEELYRWRFVTSLKRSFRFRRAIPLNMSKTC